MLVRVHPNPNAMPRPAERVAPIACVFLRGGRLPRRRWRWRRWWWRRRRWSHLRWWRCRRKSVATHGGLRICRGPTIRGYASSPTSLAKQNALRSAETKEAAPLMHSSHRSWELHPATSASIKQRLEPSCEEREKVVRGQPGKGRAEVGGTGQGRNGYRMARGGSDARTTRRAC